MIYFKKYAILYIVKEFYFRERADERLRRAAARIRRDYTMEKSVDLSNIPQKFGKYQWKNSIGCTCNFIYGNLKWLLNSIREKDLESIFDFNIDDIDENILLRQSYRTFQKQVLEVLEPGITLDEISEKTHISIYMLKKMIELGLFSLEGGEEFA